MAGIKNNNLFFIKIAVYAVITRILFACAYYLYYIRMSVKPLYSFDGESCSVIAWYIALLLKGVNVLALPMKYVPVDPWISNRIHVIIASFDGKMPALSTYGVGLYSYFLGVFYYIFGYAPLLFRFFNISIGIANAYICYRIAKDLFGEKAARITFILMLILPYQFLYSASLQRDTMVNFFCALAIFAALAVKKADRLRTKISFLSILSISLALLYPLRFSAFFMMVASLALYILVILYHKYKRLFIVGAVIVMSVPASRMKLIYFLKNKMVTLLTHHVSFASYGGSIYKLFPLKYYIFFNPEVCPNLAGLTFVETARVIMVSLKAFLIEPAILHDFKINYLFAMPEMIIWYVILIFALLGAVCSFRAMYVRRVGLLVCILIFSLVIGMSGSNMDALIRHRGMISFAYVIFAAYGMSIINDVCAKKRT